MFNIGLNNKIKVTLNPKNGEILAYPTETIKQGEIVEVCGSHDISFIDAAKIYNISKTLSGTLQINPVKIIHANTEVDKVYQKLVKEKFEKDSPTPEELEQIKSDPLILETFNNIKWLDMIIGFIPYYLQEDFPNCRLSWNKKSGLWEVVAQLEILPNTPLTLNHKLSYENKGI